MYGNQCTLRGEMVKFLYKFRYVFSGQTGGGLQYARTLPDDKAHFSDSCSATSDFQTAHRCKGEDKDAESVPTDVEYARKGYITGVALTWKQQCDSDMKSVKNILEKI